MDNQLRERYYWAVFVLSISQRIQELRRLVIEVYANYMVRQFADVIYVRGFQTWKCRVSTLKASMQ